jgi:hypothetical protein
VIELLKDAWGNLIERDPAEDSEGEPRPIAQLVKLVEVAFHRISPLFLPFDQQKRDEERERRLILLMHLTMKAAATEKEAAKSFADCSQLLAAFETSLRRIE